ncbi:uncharacterized protein ACA1_395190 [Acanthamoeba castellanii str. Neff]|uniref:Uncharacterized protein n=1 Tax=Acanthamoeba castellanii (strain ATCC 30010 / Neff) TaxID=1257118 RepID=L8H0G4_ACACF|nr:uncharacterized protein ACA1_395190 [Acanthamoeba castellanii str. Neff]ELR18702.1 hypothetical protein ACA1_395190 [Acanthamoeba castellanii str. Neff]
MPPQRLGAPSWMTSLARAEHSSDDGSWRLSNPAIEPDLPHPSNRFAFIPPRATFESIAEWATARVEERVEKGDSSEEMTSVGSDSMEEATSSQSSTGPGITAQHGINNSGQMHLQQQQSLSAEFYPIPATAHFIHHQPPPFSFSASHTPVSVVGSPQTNRRPPPRPRSASGVDAGFHPSVGYQHSGGWDVYSPTADPAAPAAAMSSSPPNFPHNGFQVSPDVNDAPHYSEVAALTSMCRFYYANLFKNVLACNLEGLQLDIDRFWEYVGKHFLGLFFYESVCHRLLQIEKSVLHEVSDALMVHPIEQRAMYMHQVAIVSDFAVQLYAQAKHLQTLAGHNSRPAQ